jgi:hypothetical protein
MQPGDIVVLWQSGKERGIYATGELTDIPYINDIEATSEEIKNQPYLKDVWWVPLVFTQILASPILAVPQLLEHPILKNLVVLKSPAGTNFQVTAEQWAAIQKLLPPLPLRDAIWRVLHTAEEDSLALATIVERGHSMGLIAPPVPISLQTLATTLANDDRFVHLEDDRWALNANEETEDLADSTSEGKKMLDENALDVEAAPTEARPRSLEEWQAGVTPKKPLLQRLVRDYPSWLQALDPHIEIQIHSRSELKLRLAGQTFQYCQFNDVWDLYIRLNETPSQDIEYLREHLSDPGSIQIPKPWGNPRLNGPRFYVRTEDDYRVLQEITRRQVDRLGGSWPEAITNPAFVVIHGRDDEYQQYGHTYAFSNYAAGDARKLADAVQAAQGSGEPVYLILYRPGPVYAFTAWAQVLAVTPVPARDPTRNDEVRWQLTLDHHEFPVPLKLKGNAAVLQKQIPWLAGGLTAAFNYRAIRQITPEEFQMIIDTARRGEQVTGDGLTLEQAFARFRSDPLEQFQVTVRRTRAAQVRQLLADPVAVTLETFNHEVWRFETETRLDGKDITGTLYGTPPLTPEQIMAAEGALASGALELHGNYIWGSGSRVYGSSLHGVDDTQKVANVRQALGILNDAQLSPMEKAEQIDSIPGFGSNITTGLVMLYHPTELAIYNEQSKAAMQKVGYDAGTLREFEAAVHQLREQLDAVDFMELDWFLYLINQGKIPVNITDRPVGGKGETDTGIWRVHFPREQWEEARAAGVIAIDWSTDSTNQSVQRFKRIKIGDRIVAYIQSGTIGGVGTVTRRFYDIREQGGERADLFGGKFFQRIGVAWNEMPPDRGNLLDKLRQPQHTTLYNRLKNPNTVIPLRSDDYSTLLELLDLEPPSETRLPDVWLALEDYYTFAVDQADFVGTAAELTKRARAFRAFTDEADEEDLVQSLRQFRLLYSDDKGVYQFHSYVKEGPALQRLMVLALLMPVEGSADTYILPAREILPRLKITDLRPAEAFAPELRADGPRLLDWYSEVNLATHGDLWQPAPGALDPLDGTDGATLAYNAFLDALQTEQAAKQETDLPSAQGPLPPVRNLQNRLRELGEELLIDPQTVHRIARSLLAGRHIVLSGPPGTGKTALAERLPILLWREAPQTFRVVTTNLNDPPVTSRTEHRQGYLPVLVTATEDWGVRDVMWGIAPVLSAEGAPRYTIQYGHVTRTVLRHYAAGGDGRQLLGAPTVWTRRDINHDDKRYRGAWLVIDEFNRAPIDAAFGSLLTALSGSDNRQIEVPSSDSLDVAVPLPADFRIIGTLNSFDRHFLNQISEALKRRFDFIDVLPPAFADAKYEEGIAVRRALQNVRHTGFHDEIVDEGDTLAWPGYIRVAPDPTAGGLRYYVTADPPAGAAIDSFWRIFSAIRVFRQLGTAQAIAVYTNLFVGALTGMGWEMALDTALADSLADQLQVLHRDEQEILAAYVAYAGDETSLRREVTTITAALPLNRRRALWQTLREAAEWRKVPLLGQEDKPETLIEDVLQLFPADAPLALSADRIFRNRLQGLIGERGI